MKFESQDRIRQDCLEVLENRAPLLDSLKNSNVVVIGGTGFLGTWIAELIAALNDSYKFCINLSLISRSIDQDSNWLPHLSNRSDITLIKSDVRQLGQFPLDADWVIHAAANPDIRTHASNPLDTASVIVDGTMSMMRTAERLGRLKKLLYLSSGLVKGIQDDSNNELSEFSNNESFSDSNFIYANSKRFAEALCSAARAQSRIPVLVARPFSFIGPYQSLDTPWAQTSFLSDALKGHQIRVKGDGQVVRSYLYGSDAAFWLLRILAAGESGDVVNVGSSNAISLEDLAREVVKNFKKSAGIIMNTSPRSIGSSKKLLPDTRHAQNKYGLSVFTPLDRAVRLTSEWHRIMQN